MNEEQFRKMMDAINDTLLADPYYVLQPALDDVLRGTPAYLWLKRWQANMAPAPQTPPSTLEERLDAAEDDIDTLLSSLRVAETLLTDVLATDALNNELDSLLRAKIEGFLNLDARQEEEESEEEEQGEEHSDVDG